jgi:hypothetical protein
MRLQDLNPGANTSRVVLLAPALFFQALLAPDTLKGFSHIGVCGTAIFEIRVKKAFVRHKLPRSGGSCS